MTELSLTVSRNIAAPATRIFDAWLDPAMLAKIMRPGPGVTIPEAKSDARVGGTFRIVMRTPEGRDIPHEGTYLEIERATRLVFTWVSEFTQDDSTVTMTLDEREDGTLVTLTHVRFPDTQARDNHNEGWGQILEATNALLAPATT